MKNKKAFRKKIILGLGVIAVAVGGYLWYSNNKEEIKTKAVETVIEKTVDAAVNKAADQIKEKAVEKLTNLINNK
jgi:hypothetical protein|tara:strand:+ start:378 stop:602 length:225 start_codon:yes stop_codon:yes gene_type:complete